MLVWILKRWKAEKGRHSWGKAQLEARFFKFTIKKIVVTKCVGKETSD